MLSDMRSANRKMDMNFMIMTDPFAHIYLSKTGGKIQTRQHW